MAFIEINKIRIAGFSAGVPKKYLDFRNFDKFKDEADLQLFKETTGVNENRRDNSLCTSDLAVPAAEKLIADLNWDKKSIEAIIFVTQTPDYVLPATSCILQDRLGLSKECYATDISLGCSGWVYGLSSAASLVAAGHGGSLRRALLIAGDSKMLDPEVSPLFGTACTVTALEYDEAATPLQFHFGTDGSGYDAIISPDGGNRNGVSKESVDTVMVQGQKTTRLNIYMNGMDVFAFGISTAPKSVKKLGEHFGFNYLDHDYFVFHQANLKMNEQIAKKLKLPNDKVPYSIQDFANTTSASIPLTIATQLKDELTQKPARLLCCGFGVGLSWGTVSFQTDGIVISDLVEVDSLTEEEQNQWFKLPIDPA